MEKTSEGEVIQGATLVYLSFINPCNSLQEALRAMLKCLGLGTTKPEKGSSSSESEEIDNEVNQPGCQESSTNTGGEVADPPSPVDPPADSVVDAATTLGRIPPRPPLNSGSRPQTNSNPS